MDVTIVTVSRPETTAAVTRGAARLLSALGYAPLAEVTLPNGRRADLMALGPKGEIFIVEVKSGVEDFRVDLKWPEYLPYCDAFAFAVSPEFPREILPEEPGLIVADGFGGAILRVQEGEDIDVYFEATPNETSTVRAQGSFLVDVNLVGRVGADPEADLSASAASFVVRPVGHVAVSRCSATPVAPGVRGCASPKGSATPSARSTAPPAAPEADFFRFARSIASRIVVYTSVFSQIARMSSSPCSRVR